MRLAEPTGRSLVNLPKLTPALGNLSASNGGLRRFFDQPECRAKEARRLL
jgi:hypothetical protein